MTLLEAVVAFVVLTVVGIACLDLSRGAMQLEHRSAEWTQAVSRAESAMATATAATPDASGRTTGSEPDLEGAAPLAGVGGGSGGGSGTVSVSRRPWRANTDLLEVTVPVSGGGVYRLQRLVPHTVQRGR